METNIKKERLDIMIVKKGLIETRNKAQQLIKSGSVIVNGKIYTKPGFLVNNYDKIEISGGIPYVSRSGIKLEQALEEFNINVKNKICLDVGSSTGGFTDCLIQHGAKRVYAIDVGHGQLAEKLKKNPIVISFEGMDIRHLDSLPEKIDIAAIDVSFISLKLILPNVKKFLKLNSDVIALIKPQFEGGKGAVNKKGVIKNRTDREKIISNLVLWIKENDWNVEAGPIESAIKGKKGNVEYLIHLKDS